MKYQGFERDLWLPVVSVLIDAEFPIDLDIISECTAAAWSKEA